MRIILIHPNIHKFIKNNKKSKHPIKTSISHDFGNIFRDTKFDFLFNSSQTSYEIVSVIYKQLDSKYSNYHIFLNNLISIENMTVTPIKYFLTKISKSLDISKIYYMCATRKFGLPISK